MIRSRAIVLATLIAGCAHGGWGSSNADHPLDAGQWLMLSSAHFRLYSDQPRSAAAEALDELERATVVLGAVAFPGVQLPTERVEVVLLDELEQLQRLSKNQQRAALFAGSGDVTAVPHMLVLTLPNGGLIVGLPELREQALHELTHCFVRRAMPRAPSWLNEGLASYWQSLELSDDGLIVGRPPILSPVAHWPPLADVVKSDPRGFYERTDVVLYYAASWGAVHQLYERHASELVRFAAALAAGRSRAAAWSESFSLSPAALDAEMRNRYATDEPMAHRLPMPQLPVIEGDTIEPVAPAAAELLFARVALLGDKASEAARHLDAAERLAPHLPSVALLRAQLANEAGQRAQAERILAEVAALHPDDPSLLLQQAAMALNGELARPEAERNFAALDPLFAHLLRTSPSAMALAVAAELAGYRHGPAAMLELAQRAVARNGQCVSCLATLAEARHRLGDDSGAVETLKLAIAAWPFEGAPRQLLARLARLQAKPR